MNKILRAADIESMTVEERLELIEQLWDSLERLPDAAIPVPKWQEEEIARRLKALDDGSASEVSWEEILRRVTGKS